MSIADRVKNAIQTTNTHSLQEAKKQFLDLIQKRFPNGEIDYSDDTFFIYRHWRSFSLEGPAEVDNPDQQIIKWIDANKDVIANICLSEMNPLSANTVYECRAMSKGYYNV